MVRLIILDIGNFKKTANRNIKYMEEIMLKKYSKLALFLVILYVIFWFGGVFINQLYSTYFNPTELSQIGKDARVIQTARNILDFSLNFLIGLWLFRISKSENRASFVWLLFGFSYGILAVILYFVIPKKYA